MTPTDELTKRLSRVLMDHAVQFLDLIDATLLLVVEAKDGNRYWLSNGQMREEFRLESRKKGIFQQYNTDEMCLDQALNCVY